MEALHQPHDLPGRLRVQIARRLVRKHDVRFVDEGSCDGDPLLLAPGELRGLLHRDLIEADRRESIERLLTRFLRVVPADEERQLDVLHALEDGQEVVVLEDEPHLHRAEIGFPDVAQGREALACDPDFAGREVVDSGEAVQERRLAAPGRAHDGDHLPLSDVEVEATERLDGPAAAVVRLHEATRDDDAVLRPRGLGRSHDGRWYGDGFGRHRGPGSWADGPRNPRYMNVLAGSSGGLRSGKAARGRAACPNPKAPKRTRKPRRP